MSEWWTYELSDLLLFSPRVWERLLASYGAAVWPAQVAFALAGLVLLTGRGPRSRRLTLGAAWAFSGMVFHLQHYATINPYARWIGLMFVLQAILLLAAGRGPDSAVHPVRAAAGRLLCAAAVLGWPFMAPALARPWAAAEVFGTHPDPPRRSRRSEASSCGTAGSGLWRSFRSSRARSAARRCTSWGGARPSRRSWRPASSSSP